MSKEKKRILVVDDDVAACESSYRRRAINQGRLRSPGNSLHFVFTDSTNRRFDRRVKAEQLLEKGVNPDERKYLQLLYTSAASLF